MLFRIQKKIQVTVRDIMLNFFSPQVWYIPPTTSVLTIHIYILTQGSILY